MSLATLAAASPESATSACGASQESACSIHSHAGAAFFCQQLATQGFAATDLGPSERISRKVLVAGCGSGHEAIAIQARLDADVDAVDIEDFVDPNYRTQARTHFQVASVCELPFEDGRFDAIFYHHVIEHVDHPAESLVELNRVLRPGGWIFIGTPNRHRLISSIGAHRQAEWEATFYNKLGDNIRDWSDRLTGKFRNEFGAHAGFSRGELDRMLAKHFPRRQWLTSQYLEFKYGTSAASRMLPIATHPAIAWFAAPSIYVLCQRP
jgi:SAM-dependent methyltransferase